MAALAANNLALAAPEQIDHEQENFAAAPSLLRDRPLVEYIQWEKPAAGDSRPAEDYLDNYVNDVGDAFRFAPGVWVNNLDLAEPRLSIRGFAISNRQERSNIIALRDGAPLTDVHGETNTAEVDLLALERVDIYRGGGGDLAVVGENLGGAVNFVSKTGRTAKPGISGRLEGGSTIGARPVGQVHGEIAHVSGDLDYYVSATGRYEQGLRDNNQRIETYLNANLGYEFSPAVQTRVFLDVARSDIELAGGLTLADALADPTQASGAIGLGPLFPGGPFIELADSANDDEFGRQLFTGRIANETRFRVFGLDGVGGLHYTRREVEAPQIDFIGVIDESADEWGARLSLGRRFLFFGVDTDLRAGGSYTTGEKSSDRFENIDGAPGDELFATTQKSTNLTGFLEAVVRPLRRLAVDFGAKFITVDRELTVDDNLDAEEFTGVSAKVGAQYTLTDHVQLFINGSRTYEPPSFSELVSDNPEDLNDLEEQDSFSFEGGIRGRFSNWLGWDLTYFNTDVENEIINIDDPETNGVGGTLVNVDSTTHKGVEAGVDIHLFPQRLGRNGHSLTWRNAYSYNNFRFDDGDPLGVDGNRLAGVPEHVYRGELRYSADDVWYAGVNVEVAGGEFFADHENVVSVPTYTIVGFSAGYRMSDRLEVFATGENLTDNTYIAGLTPVLNQEDQEGRIFTPGARAALYGGVRYRF